MRNTNFAVTAIIVAVSSMLLGSQAINPAYAAGGPVVLMGIDAEDGGVGGHGSNTEYQAVKTDLESNVSNGGSGLLVIGGGKDPLDDVTEFWDAVAAGTGQTVTYANGAAGIAAQSFSGFAVIAVASGEDETSDGGLTQAENDALCARAADIADHVNGGGALWGMSQTGMTIPYCYLTGVGAFTFNTGLSYDNVTATPAGEAIGLDDTSLDLCCWHDEYLTFPSFLEVLMTNVDSGEAAAIGGAQVIIPPPTVVGGEILPIDASALFLAGAAANTQVLAPMLGGIASAAAVLITVKRVMRSRRNKKGEEV